MNKIIEGDQFEKSNDLGVDNTPLFDGETSDKVSDILESLDMKKVRIIIEISKELGLEETPEMLEIRNHILETISKNESAKHLFILYEESAKLIIDEYKGTQFNKAQIALCLLKASILLEGLQLDDYRYDIEDVLEYARGMRYHSIVESVESLQ